jgi:hypothetical protein
MSRSTDFRNHTLLQYESSLCQGPIFYGILSATARAAIDRRGCIEFLWVRE